MDNAEDAANAPNDPAPARQAKIFGHATSIVIGALPKPVPATPEAFAARNVSAVSQIAALVPVNAIETMFAVQIVVAVAQGVDSQRQAQVADPTTANHHIHQAAKMMRVSQGAANVLLRLQAARQKREATQESANSALLTEHCALQLMLQALTRLEAAQAAAEKAAAEQAQAEAEARAMPPPPPPEPPPLTTDHIVAAEQYATSSPANANRARIIRRKGLMPNWGMFDAPADEVINALVHGHSPILDALLPGPA